MERANASLEFLHLRDQPGYWHIRRRPRVQKMNRPAEQPLMMTWHMLLEY